MCFAHHDQRRRLFGRCVSAEAAADFAALLDFGSRSTLDAADAAFLLVTSLFLAIFYHPLSRMLVWLLFCPFTLPRGG